MLQHYVEIQHAVAELVEPIHDALAAARLTVDEKHKGLLRDKDQQWLRTALIRGLVYRELERVELSGWVLGGEHARNGEVHLCSRDGTMTIRVLREAPDQTIPAAGHNRRRRAYYANVLPYGLDLWGSAHHSLLLLWGEPDPADDFTVRLVRPLEPGKYRKSGRADLDIDLPRSKTDFMALKFEVYDEEYEQPGFQIADEEFGGDAT
ncbi:hypothetical protein MAHJHV61_33110 [Mycobacterium avium subsp. hominissuis]|uniref:hypothetical protein n=1 Tax=Mycobacterium avium TaxID=1764 RepID=UPI000A027E05|nr:hypothetical protein [Mycobacterium avium]